MVTPFNNSGYQAPDAPRPDRQGQYRQVEPIRFDARNPLPINPAKVYVQNVIYGVIENEPLPGCALEGHIKSELDSLPAHGRQQALDELVQHKGLLRATANAFTKINKHGDNVVDYRYRNRTRKANYVRDMTEWWQGNGWVPRWPKYGDGELCTVESTPFTDVFNLHTISKMARKNNFDLPALYQPGGSWLGHDDDPGLGFSDNNSAADEEEQMQTHEAAVAEARVGKRKSGEVTVLPRTWGPDVSKDFDDPVKAWNQISRGEWLSDDTIDLMHRLILQYVSEIPGDSNVDEWYIVNPLFIELSRPQLPAVPHSLSKRPHKFILVPLHHRHPSKHWTIAKIDLEQRLITWYDPHPNQIHDAEALRLTSWLEPKAKPFQFRVTEGPRQTDGVSCGVFVLNAMRCWLQGLGLPLSFDEPNAFLLSLLESADSDEDCSVQASRNTSPVPPSLKRFREGKITNQEVTSLADVGRQLQGLKALLQRQLEAFPREDLETLRLTLARQTQWAESLETELATLPVSIAKVRRYQAAARYLKPVMQVAPHDPNLPRDEQLLGLGAVMNNLAEDHLAPFRVDGADIADLAVLLARQDALPQEIENAWDRINDLRVRVDREIEWLALGQDVEGIRGMVRGEN
ncbi:hypothetical protein NW762_013402 [Fusarium torreyae]|uniref:Ubiquitin-like protease family profile domain-containing protein n=1 Tax=Fusarium torreyae TaxID=1237075 RepID=A0A9W8V8R4_9HYPO|nr:hypothetical protein NW762_013402 [Fusarium torreyae]